MAKWWIGSAIIVLCVGGGPALRAQALYPTTGSSTVTDPVPYAPAQSYSMPPAAMSPPVAPVATPGLMPALPGGTPNINTAEVQDPEPHCWYSDIGAVVLMRQRLGDSVLAVRDPQMLDTGRSPTGPLPVESRFGEFQPDFDGGVQATIGYKWDGFALEASGFYMPRQTSLGTKTDPGRLDSFFYNPPLGFEGDNGLWLQADQMRIGVTETVSDAELNARWWSHNYFTNWELLTGVRYMNIMDEMSIFTDDDGVLIRQLTGQPDPTRQATYDARGINHIIAPQLGLRWCGQCCNWLTMGFSSKAAVGPNFAETEVSLVRGDGYLGFDTRNSERTVLSQVYDLSLYFTIHPWDGVYVRAGYMCLWAVDVAEGQRQVDFNLQDHIGRQDDEGSIFYNGPFVQFELFF
jgi:hypothetical protein